MLFCASINTRNLFVRLKGENKINANSRLHFFQFRCVIDINNRSRVSLGVESVTTRLTQIRLKEHGRVGGNYGNYTHLSCCCMV
jgi:hypothetical protein